MRAPSASVIVPTKDRPRMLGDTVRSLAEQSYPAVGFEIIVGQMIPAGKPWRE